MTWLARAVAVLLLVLALPAYAHNLSVAHVTVKASAADRRQLVVEVDLSLKDLALTLPLDGNHDESVTWGELQAARAALEELVRGGITLHSLRGDCAMQPTRLGVRDYDDGAYATLVLDARCPSVGPLKVDYRLFMDRDPQHRAIVMLRDGPRFATGIARAGATSVRLDTRSDNALLQFLREGVHHILIGYDHIAFLLSLVLPALLAWRQGRWRADGDVRRHLLDVLWLVTAFTVAHSVTLTLATVGLVTPASRPVEVLIAASVLFAAVNNIRPMVVRRLWLLSFGFGLVHGFGFAGALSEIGLPPGGRFLALFGFNLGVELGQLMLLAVILPCLLLARRSEIYARWVVPLLSALIALLAGAWILQRLGL